jgi:hypothetical protein
MGVFKLKPEGLNMDDLELELIDFGLEELEKAPVRMVKYFSGSMRLYRFWQYAKSIGRKRHHSYQRRT